MIKTPYLLFLGDAGDPLSTKVAQGIKDWRPEYSIGQYRMHNCQADVNLPNMDFATAVKAGARTLVIGVANRGGALSDNWQKLLIKALIAGLDIASGLHNFLRDQPQIVAAAQKYGRKLHDVRVPVVRYPIASGKKRRGKRCLTVGSDCSVGKMYTSLALEKEMKARGLAADFLATGQTGILITGGGVPLDAVIADFMAGSIEYLTPAASAQHWDLIEGQGSLYHVSYSGVSLALLHGGQPDALILCHEPTRKHMRGLPDYALPKLEDLKETALTLGRVVNPAVRVVGISINSQHLEQCEAKNYLAGIESRLGLPTVDPFRDGAARLVDALLEI